MCSLQLNVTILIDWHSKAAEARFNSSRLKIAMALLAFGHRIAAACRVLKPPDPQSVSHPHIVQLIEVFEKDLGDYRCDTSPEPALKVNRSRRAPCVGSFGLRIAEESVMPSFSEAADTGFFESLKHMKTSMA